MCFSRLRPSFGQDYGNEAGLIFPGVGAAPLIAYKVSMKAIETLLTATEEDVREALKAASFEIGRRTTAISSSSSS
jgi:hypothetical protein